MAGLCKLDRATDGEYYCSLDLSTQEKALKELKEDPKERESCVQTFREILGKQPSLKCPTAFVCNFPLCIDFICRPTVNTITYFTPTRVLQYLLLMTTNYCGDSAFLLAFLRARKFSQLEALELMKRHLMMKTKMRNWFENVDPSESGIMAVLKDGFAYPLPRRNSNGCLLVVFNYGKIQPWSGRYTKRDVLRAIVCVTYFLFFTCEDVQVNGIVIINDLSSMCFKHQTLFNLEEQRLFYGGWHKSIPARIKQICLYNAGSFGDFVYMILKLVTPEKLTQRIINCGSSLEMLYKEIDVQLLPLEYLPEDYEGPHGGTAAENVDRMIEDMLVPKARERIMYLSDPEFCFDLSKASPNISMSFRKLNVE